MPAVMGLVAYRNLYLNGVKCRCSCMACKRSQSKMRHPLSADSRGNKLMQTTEPDKADLQIANVGRAAKEVAWASQTELPEARESVGACQG